MGKINFQITTNEISIKNNFLADGTYQFAPVFTRQIQKDEKTGRTRLIMEAKNTKENPFPVDIRVDVTATVDMTEIPEEAQDKFLELNVVQILLPYVRSMISNTTGSALMVPILLPLLDAQELFEKKE